MALITRGSKVTVNGITGFGLINSIIYCVDTKRTLFNVELYRTNNIQYPCEIVLLCAEDVKPFEAAQGKAKHIKATDEGHAMAFLEMAGL
jgi:hypothetical protein